MIGEGGRGREGSGWRVGEWERKGEEWEGEGGESEGEGGEREG